ncbi:MAG: NADH-quinone oxidoreductase subunit M [Verrucomicrobia bacterium]|nr:NADH-quinone oxidoreductase subunit M [Verrucomicrobiota bacterium]
MSHISTITFLLLWPFLGAIVIALLPRDFRLAIRAVALASTLFSLLLAIKVFLQFDASLLAPQFVQKVLWVEAIGISYHVGVDGLNVGLILMGAIVAFAAACVSSEIETRHKEYYFLLLVMIGGILGAFASLDLFFFYFFHELALIPTFIMIGLWGKGENRIYATYKITIYLSIGALLALIGLIALYLHAGGTTFDMIALTKQLSDSPLAPESQHLIFPLLLFGFGILVSLWPFHTWAPLGYAAAPTATAMLHAGVLKKFGLYGLIRIAIPMMPEAAHSWMHVLAFLCLGNILFCGFVAMRQKDLLLLIGNSSVAHMGFAFLGIASLNLIGITGAILVMIAHGLLAALTFALAGYLYRQTHTLRMDQIKGLLPQIPFVGTVSIMALLAGCGLPGFANFVGEVTVFFGAWKQYPFVTALSVWGALVIGGVYMLRAIRTIFHGPANEGFNKMTDAVNPLTRLPYLLLLGSLLCFGFFPRLLSDKIKPAADAVAKLAAVARESSQPIESTEATVTASSKIASSVPTSKQ